MCVQLTEFEKRTGDRARHRALILQILKSYHGLTHNQIVMKEQELYGYIFLTDNRLRELRQQGWVKSIKQSDGLLHWFRTEDLEYARAHDIQWRK